MSDDNVISFNPVTVRDMPKEVKDDILTSRRDEMLEVLKGIIGRVESYEMTGIIMIGFSDIPHNDIVYTSAGAYDDPAKTVGSLEMVKHQHIAGILSDED